MGIVTAIAQLGISIIVVLVMIVLLNRRLRRSQQRAGDWQAEWRISADLNIRWPYTRLIDRLGGWYRTGKGILPAIGAVLLIISAFVSSPPAVHG